MDSIVDAELSDRAQILQLLGAFAGLAIILAAFGTYGVLSCVVSLRTREIGLRMAVGATRPEIMRAILSYSSAPLCARLRGWRGRAAGCKEGEEERREAEPESSPAIGAD